MLRLWKYNRITGFWVAVRTVTQETAEAWLSVWQKDEPNEQFAVSSHKPRQLA